MSEGHGHRVAGLHRNRGRDRTREDNVPGIELRAPADQLVGQPGRGVQRLPEHRRARAGGDDSAVATQHAASEGQVNAVERHR